MAGVTAKNYFATLNLIYFAIMTVMIVFSAVAAFVGSPTADPQLAETLKFIVPVAVVVFLTASYFVHKVSLQRIKKAKEFKSKLAQYQSAVLIRAAPIEGAGLLGAVATLVTGEMFFLAATAVSVILFILQRPTIFSVVEDLSLTPAEKARLENPNEIIAERPTTNS
jgi:hypothetical protein